METLQHHLKLEPKLSSLFVILITLCDPNTQPQDSDEFILSLTNVAKVFVAVCYKKLSEDKEDKPKERDDENEENRENGDNSENGVTYKEKEEDNYHNNYNNIGNDIGKTTETNDFDENVAVPTNVVGDEVGNKMGPETDSTATTKFSLSLDLFTILKSLTKYLEFDQPVDRALWRPPPALAPTPFHLKLCYLAAGVLVHALAFLSSSPTPSPATNIASSPFGLFFTRLWHQSSSILDSALFSDQTLELEGIESDDAVVEVVRGVSMVRYVLATVLLWETPPEMTDARLLDVYEPVGRSRGGSLGPRSFTVPMTLFLLAGGAAEDYDEYWRVWPDAWYNDIYDEDVDYMFGDEESIEDVFPADGEVDESEMGETIYFPGGLGRENMETYNNYEPSVGSSSTSGGGAPAPGNSGGGGGGAPANGAAIDWSDQPRGPNMGYTQTLVLALDFPLYPLPPHIFHQLLKNAMPASNREPGYQSILQTVAVAVAKSSPYVRASETDDSAPFPSTSPESYLKYLLHEPFPPHIVDTTALVSLSPPTGLDCLFASRPQLALSLCNELLMLPNHRRWFLFHLCRQRVFSMGYVDYINKLVCGHGGFEFKLSRDGGRVFLSLVEKLMVVNEFLAGCDDYIDTDIPPAVAAKYISVVCVMIRELIVRKVINLQNEGPLDYSSGIMSFLVPKIGRYGVAREVYFGVVVPAKVGEESSDGSSDGSSTSATTTNTTTGTSAGTESSANTTTTTTSTTTALAKSLETFNKTGSQTITTALKSHASPHIDSSPYITTANFLLRVSNFNWTMERLHKGLSAEMAFDLNEIIIDYRVLMERSEEISELNFVHQLVLNNQWLHRGEE